MLSLSGASRDWYSLNSLGYRHKGQLHLYQFHWARKNKEKILEDIFSKLLYQQTFNTQSHSVQFLVYLSFMPADCGRKLDQAPRGELRQLKLTQKGPRQK